MATVITLIDFLLLALAIVVVIPVAVATIEIVAGVLGRQKSALPAPDSTPTDVSRPRVAILVPAHNEAAILRSTLQHLAVEKQPADRLLVVADNCSDETASIAAQAGAEVLVRTDTANRGKGFALDYGIKHLAQDAPDIVVIIDADCRTEPGSISRIASLAHATSRPVQAHYDMRIPDQQRQTYLAVAAFAWRVKNRIRAHGLKNLGLPCQLMGTGMAFPWSVIANAPLATSDIVEDLVLGLELARRGTPPLFAPDATVISYFPVNQTGQEAQRSRWETGHLQTIARIVPGVFSDAIRGRTTFAAIALAADVAVPPLAFLVLMIMSTMLIVSVASLFTGPTIALWIILVASLVFTAAIIIAWIKVGRDVLTLRELISVPRYVLGKLTLYARTLNGAQLAWVRSKRDVPPTP